MKRLIRIEKREGNSCLLACGHRQKSRGKTKAFCKECEKSSLHLIDGRQGRFLFKTTMTNHKECMEKLACKCRWEQMTRTAILINYPKIVCDKCLKKMEFKKVGI